MSNTLSFIGIQITIYAGIIIFIAGVIGDFLNIFLFLSLKTFRKNSCALYLITMSIFNIGTLCIGLSARIATALTGIDTTETSLFYCKFRLYLNQICGGVALTCWCLAIIDQYFATCSRPHWQQLCNIKLAQRIITLTILLWALHSIPCLIFRSHVTVSNTNRVTCTDTNYIFQQYRAYFVLIGLLGYLPIVVTIVFGMMAYRNVKQISYRTVPLVRRELDKQLTVMVLIQVIIGVFTLLPYTTVNAVATNNNLTSNPIIQEKLQFSITVTITFFYVNFASPFYIYIYVSERYRRQLIYVLSKILSNRCYRPRADTHQVAPET